MPTYRLTLAYRGTAYAGWQRQENALAVQQVVEEALERLLGRPVRIAGASRTDAGVHARGQVAHLELAAPFPARGLVHGTNHHLPEDVRVLAAAEMPDGFHARKHACGQGVRLPAEPRRRPLAARLPLRGAGAGRDRPRTDGQSGGPSCQDGTISPPSPSPAARTGSRSGDLLRRAGRRAERSCASASWGRGSCAAWFVLWWEP